MVRAVALIASTSIAASGAAYFFWVFRSYEDDPNDDFYPLLTESEIRAITFALALILAAAAVVLGTFAVRYFRETPRQVDDGDR
jgi:hypothetical protein